MRANATTIVGRAALALVVLVPLAASLSACNTTQGFGKDVSNTGQAISNEAQKDKPQ